jgi:ferredoxin-NADP reductase
LAASAELAVGVVRYRFTLSDEDRAIRWRPGQFISLTCGKQDNGEPLLRSYSIASRPDGDGLDLVVRLIEGGAASGWLAKLSVGDEVRFTGPMGFFVLELQHTGDLVFAATGTGIAPIVPMIEEALERTETGRIHLYWGLRAEEDLFWRERIEELAASPRFSSALHLTRAGDAWPGPRGRIIDPVMQLLPSLTKPTFYLCGNGAMITDLKKSLVSQGVDRKRQIRTEAFFD